MLAINAINELRNAVRATKRIDKSVGCVMTMGALHAGHRSLLETARKQTDFVVATIFVNPTQFAPGEDLDRYPRPLENDLAICKNAGVDIVFLPDVETMYPQGAQTVVTVSTVSQPLEGASRPTHFAGVTTIVLKLLNLVQPDTAFFGQKDYQQCAVIRQMVKDLDVPVDVCTVPTVRDDDGVALSSRNQYLSDDERLSARKLNEALRHAECRFAEGEANVPLVVDEMQQLLNTDPRIQLEYAVIVDPDNLEELVTAETQMVALVAAKVGSTRLIDNTIITCS